MIRQRRGLPSSLITPSHCVGAPHAPGSLGPCCFLRRLKYPSTVPPLDDAMDVPLSDHLCVAASLTCSKFLSLVSVAAANCVVPSLTDREVVRPSPHAPEPTIVGFPTRAVPPRNDLAGKEADGSCSTCGGLTGCPWPAAITAACGTCCLCTQCEPPFAQRRNRGSTWHGFRRGRRLVNTITLLAHCDSAASNTDLPPACGERRCNCCMSVRRAACCAALPPQHPRPEPGLAPQYESQLEVPPGRRHVPSVQCTAGAVPGPLPPRLAGTN